MVRTNAYFLMTALIRTYAIWLAAQTLIALPPLFMQAKSWGDGGRMFFLGTNAAILLIAALVWLFADVIARIGIARPQQSLFESDMSFQDWQSIFFSTIGLWLLVQGLLHLFREALRWFIVHQMSEHNGYVPVVEGQIENNVSAALETAIGVGLLMCGRGLAGLLQRVRGQGSMPREEGQLDK